MLLSGNRHAFFRELLRAFFFGWLWKVENPSEFIEVAGFRGAKIKVGRPHVSEDVARLSAVRDAVGPGFEIMVDANQAFTVPEAIRRARHYEPLDLAWFEEGAYTADGRVFDVGVQTSRAFRAILGGASPEVSGPSAERENGNGSLMRVLPLALFHDGPLEELVTLAERQSLPTHGHLRSRVSCAFYCVWARHELSGHTDGFARAAADLRPFHQPVQRLQSGDAPDRRLVVGGGEAAEGVMERRAALRHLGDHVV